MKKLLKVLGIVFILIVLVLTIGFWILNEPLPKGVDQYEGDALAELMMESLDYEAWQATETVSWTFRGEHHYEWNKAEDLVTVSWAEHEIYLLLVIT